MVEPVRPFLMSDPQIQGLISERSRAPQPRQCQHGLGQKNRPQQPGEHRLAPHATSSAATRLPSAATRLPAAGSAAGSSTSSAPCCLVVHPCRRHVRVPQSRTALAKTKEDHRAETGRTKNSSTRSARVSSLRGKHSVRMLLGTERISKMISARATSGSLAGQEAAIIAIRQRENRKLYIPAMVNHQQYENTGRYLTRQRFLTVRPRAQRIRCRR